MASEHRRIPIKVSLHLSRSDDHFVINQNFDHILGAMRKNSSCLGELVSVWAKTACWHWWKLSRSKSCTAIPDILPTSSANSYHHSAVIFEALSFELAYRKGAMVPNINLDQLHISDIQAFLITTQVKSNRITFIRSLCINKFMFLIAPSFSRQRFLSASLSALRWLSRLLCCSRAFSRSSCLRLDSKPFLLPTWKTKNTKRLSSTHHKELLSLWFPNSIEEALHVNLHGALYKCKIIHFEVTIRILHQLMISVKV